MKLKFSRVQEVEVELKRDPTVEELKILLGKDSEAIMFDLLKDLIEWDSEEVVGEDYSSNRHIYIPRPKLKIWKKYL
jgi:glyceraldehyde-3-phosphate dehydrogenase/erythrose-4-phosphate dehydrogenase